MCLKIANDSVCGVASRVAVTEQCRTLHNKVRCDLFRSPNIFISVTCRRMRLVEHCAGSGKKGMLSEV